MVALALSAGGGCLTTADGGMLWGMSTAYAAETHEYTETKTSINGLEGTDKTHSMNDNKITLGTEGGPTDKPFSTWGTISGGGKKNAAEDVSNNTLTIHGLKVSNGGGQSMIYGGVSGTGAVTNNRVFFNNGLSKDPIYGGFNDASATKAVTGNSVTVAGGTVEGDAFGGYTTGKGAVTGNSVTIKGGSLGDEAAGGVIGNSSSSANASDNTLTISGGAFTKSGGTNVFGAYNAGSGKTINNIVNLGDGENAMASGFDLTRVKIYGGNETNDVTGNTLNVNASGIVVRTAQNFEKYNFNLTKGVAAGSTMLKVTDSGGFGSTPDVQWKNITMSAEGWNADTTKYGRLGTMELLRTGSGADLKIFNTEALDRKATSGDFEYHMYTDVTTPPMSFFGYNMVNYVRADIDRFQNADATADNVTGTEVYGGYSSLGNTTTNNKIKITNTNNTNLTVYGGYTAGAGDSANNHVTITATGKVKAAYGGYATAANSKAEGNNVTVESGGWVDNISYAGWAKGAVNRNIFTVKGHADWSVYGGKLDGSGKAEGNEVRIEGGTVMGEAVGAKGNADSTVTGNKVVVTGGTVKKDVVGGQTGGVNGKTTGNTVTIANSTVEGFVQAGRTADGGTVSDNQVSILDSIIKKGIIGGSDSANGNVTGNTITVSGVSTVEGVVYGGYSGKSGIVTDNKVTIAGGTFQEPVYGGYSDKSGTVADNKVTLTGGTFQKVIYGGAGGDTSATGTFTVNNNTVTIAGGTFSTNIYGGYSWKADGTTENNTVNLGNDTHTDLSGATLAASNIYGGNKAATGNTLNVNAKNVTAKSVNNFENYKFKLNESFGNGDTMLSVANAGAFGGTGVDWGKISVDRSGLSADYVSNVHGVYRVTLLKSAMTNGLHFQNYATTIYTATDTHESAVQTDTDSGTATSVFMEINRFKNGRVAYDGTGETYAKAWGNEIYGGLSHDGHTTTGNQLTVKALRGAGDPSHVFGGKNEGTTGDVTQNTVNIELAHDADKIKEVYGGQANNEDGTGKVDGNIANMNKGTVDLLHAGYTFGTGAVTNNTVNFSGGTVNDYVSGGYIDKATSTAEVSYNKVLFTNGTAGQIRGGVTTGSGAAKKNAVEFSAGTAEEVRGAEIEGGTAEENEVTVKGGTVSGDVYGASTTGMGTVSKNKVTVTGGTIEGKIYGGYGYHATDNEVTISGGALAGIGTVVYGGYMNGPGSSASGNVVNLGADDGTYTANLSGALIYGDNSTDNAVHNNVLNVRGKGITVHSIKNFDKYNFKLNNNIASGDTMLTLRNDGFGREIDFANNFNVDTSKLTGKPTGTITLLKSETANALTFKDGYAPRDLGSTTNAEYFIGTDTGTRTATSVIMNYSLFKDNAWTYDGTNPATANEVAGGISYKDGHTTYNNKITVTGVPSTNLNFVYGGKTNGAADSKENQVTIESTGTGSIANINGGFTNKADGVASKNRVLIKGGTVTNAIGGAVSGASGSATDNEVTVEGGTVANVIGGAGSAAAAGNMSNNRITITGGTVTGQIVGGDSRVLTSTSNNNTITLGGGTLTGSEVWGTSYGGKVLANTDAKIAGNTLNVKAKDGVTLKKVRNVEKFNFQLLDDTTKTTPLLNLTEVGGFGKVTADNSDVKVKWSNVTADMSKVTTEKDAAKIQGKNTYILMRAADPTLKFSDYAARYDTYGGVYETGLRTNTNTDTAQEVLYDVNRFKDGRVTYTTTSTGEALGGYSAFGHTTEGNALAVQGVTGTLAAAYGGKTAGTTGDSVNNTVTIEGTGTGSITNVYGGAITNSANAGAVTGNTVNFFGGRVGTLYGGYTAGGGTVAGNTLNVRGVQRAGDVKNFEKLHFDTSMTNAGDTILTLNGGTATTGLDWQKLEAAGLDEGKLRTLTKVTRDELFSLMANADGLNFGTTYDKAKEKTVGDYEYSIDTDTKNAAAQKVTVRGFQFQNNADAVYDTGNNLAAWGGRSIIGNTVQRNKLTVTGGTLTGAAYGGLSAKGAVTGNTLVLAGGTVAKAYGGFVEGAGSATGNIVNVQADTHAAEIYGGRADHGEASSNVINLGNITIGAVDAKIFGGSGQKTDGNVINLWGTKITGANSLVTGGTAANGKGNTLAIRTAGTEIRDFTGIQNLKFYLPETANSSTPTMLKLGVQNKNIEGLGVGLEISGAAKHLQKNDEFSLMKVAAGGTLTTDEKIKSEVTGTQGASLNYKFRVQKKGTDELIAAVESVGMNSATKSLAETRAAAADVLNSGMNMLADAGVSSAVEAASAANRNVQAGTSPTASGKAPGAKTAAAANAQSGVYTAWAAQSGSAMRIHSGSYVDTHGYTLNVGFARKQESKDGTLTYGPFVEYGRASYDSYLEDAAGTHADGKVSYVGAGLLARQDWKSGFYLEGSIRGGRIKSDYAGVISERATSYDISNPYYALHLGVGKKTKLKAGDSLEAYLKYFYSHQNGTSAKLATGEDYDFDAVNSHRVRLGARYAHDMGESGHFYAGLAWEYEFEGEARATYQGMSTPSPSIKGASAMLELGYRFAPKDSRVSYDLNVNGWQGKREGFTASVGVNWAF